MKAASFIGQQKERADSIMTAFGSTSSHDDRMLVVAGLAIAGLIAIWILISKYSSDPENRH